MEKKIKETINQDLAMVAQALATALVKNKKGALQLLKPYLMGCIKDYEEDTNEGDDEIVYTVHVPTDKDILSQLSALAEVLEDTDLW